MTATGFLSRAPKPIREWALHFECAIDRAVRQFAAQLAPGAFVLDAGAGECRHRQEFSQQRYIGVDLGVGDSRWNYGHLDVVADLTALPFATATFDAALNVVTLEHLSEPAAALREIGRVLRTGAPFLLVAPLEWEEHQQPHDYFRYTRYGLALLLRQAGFEPVTITPAGGFFRLLSRRLLNGLQFFMSGARWILFLPAAIVFVPLSLLLLLFEPLDTQRNFTLGYICLARKL
ncbi:class I SAM-dependent methyltransferase [Nevskia soli]|uniref:class I SAM-dependent methyltransferase n=1 Tax=Nevskia soli TaxID=418856 RepID=UPI0015D8E675|nr:class I SAM-dependent methyltransferase [Nevskia soli]